MPVPYALSLRPGATVVGDLHGASLYVQNDSDAAYSKGLYGYAAASSGTTIGVLGQTDSDADWATAGEGATFGVRGQSDSTSGLGVYGYASAASGQTYGVAGQSQSPTGYGVYGYNSSTSGLAAASPRGEMRR